jgi:D-alanyl-D-alanine carboxypeptidase/D-alanyl-D-alanine-endopeptidase (penicillin-binding protein 4)
MKRIFFSIVMSLAAFLPAGAKDFGTWVKGMESRGIKVSAGIWDLDTGKLLEGQQMDQALVPASTTKVISTYALLKSLKPNYVLETELWGTLAGGVVQGDLVFKGVGDPYLTSERLWLMAQDLKGRGITRIQGHIRLDQSAYDGQHYGNGWENTSLNTTPPILPLSVNFNRDEQGTILQDPEPLAVQTITRIFRETGIQVLDQPGREGEMTKILAFQSPPLRALVQDINKYSNNFMIEMLLKRFGDGSWPRGVQRIQSFYKDALDLGPDKIAITDGSGLSKDNRLSARTLVTVLRAAWNDYEVGPEFVSSLKIIGGEPWELSVKDPNLAWRIRCKTGHLSGVTSVCGYMQMPDGKRRVFAILLNGNARTEDAWSMVSDWAN